MGMIVTVYRAPPSQWGDATNGGVSSRATRLCVVNVPGPFEPSADVPGVELVSHVRGCVSLVPTSETDARMGSRDYAGPMMGGNYAGTCDSRFNDKVRKLLGQDFYGAVAIHDRFDTWADNEILSR
jgi:hypothetical protein